MKFKLLLLGLALVCSGLFAVNGSFAQGCRAQLISDSGVIIDIFNGSKCKTVRKRCNRKLHQLRSQDPYFYQYAYCDVVNTPHYVSPRHHPIPRSQSRSYVSPRPHPIPQPQPRSHVTRSYDRCQAPGIVRCTQEWSDGRVVIEDYSCSGCRGYGNPAGDPCGWSCSFPQK